MFRFFGYQKVYVCAQCGEVYKNNPCKYGYIDRHSVCYACGCEIGKPYRNSKSNLIEAVAKRKLFAWEIKTIRYEQDGFIQFMREKYPDAKKIKIEIGDSGYSISTTNDYENNNKN